MADGIPPAQTPAPEPEPEPKPTGATPRAAAARATLGKAAGAIASAVAALARAIVLAAPHAALLAKKWLIRLVEFRPTPLVTLAMLGGGAALSVVGSLSFPNNAIGQVCAVVLVPGLSIAFGIIANRWYRDQAPTPAVVNYQALHLTRSVRFVDERLAAAQVHLQNGDAFGALIEVVRAKTATELGTEPSPQGAPTTAPAARVGDHSDGCIARVEDQHTLIINRGSEHGVRPDMVFAVMADGGDKLIDPETGEVIGDLPTEKLRVKVFNVQPKYSWAGAVHSRLSLTSVADGPQINQQAPTKPADLEEVTVDIGDKVRHVA